ncbi:MAG TPA: hypothetical protein VM470_08960 [Acidimicrobiia bacterium]|nr:hypothetical protein [Acidimicrobiia bacterium]
MRGSIEFFVRESSNLLRSGFVVAIVGTLVVAIATPALADGAVPTTYRSEVTALAPDLPEITVEVLGGDAFLSITADPGLTVEVPGYEGEPYLRFDPDGTISVNINSPAYWLNDDRFGSVTLPPTATAEAAPDWREVGSGGTYAWHDHRIHWMSPNPPPGVDENQPTQIQTWLVPIVVDEKPVTVEGTLHWVPRQSPLPWLGVAVVAGVASWFLTPLLALSLASLVALIFGLGQAITTPLGFASELLSFLPPLLALGLTVLGLVREAQPTMLGAIGAIFLGIWAGLRISYMTMPVLPLPVSPTLLRVGLAIVIGATLAAAARIYLVMRNGSPGSR